LGFHVLTLLPAYKDGKYIFPNDEVSRAIQPSKRHVSHVPSLLDQCHVYSQFLGRARQPRFEYDQRFRREYAFEAAFSISIRNGLN
jgi:hypothetical protein